MTQYRSIDESRTIITELMIPSYANFGGKVHGGVILSLMDKVAYACASQHARQYCVTASVDAVDFRGPVEVGEVVHLKASVNFVGNTSLEIGIRTESQNILTGERRHTNTSYFTMVAMGADGKPSPVPGLILTNEEDVRRFLEAIRRRELARSYREAYQQAKSTWQVTTELDKLEGRNCRLDWQP